MSIRHPPNVVPTWLNQNSRVCVFFRVGTAALLGFRPRRNTPELLSYFRESLLSGEMEGLGRPEVSVGHAEASLMGSAHISITVVFRMMEPFLFSRLQLTGLV